jgi:hypothetical protein
MKFFESYNASNNFLHIIRITNNKGIGALLNVVLPSKDGKKAELYVDSFLKNDLYKARYLRGWYIPKKINIEEGIYWNKDNGWNTDVSGEKFKKIISPDILITTIEKEEQKANKKMLILGEKTKIKYSITQITDKKIIEDLFNAAIKTGNEMYGDNGTHGRHFRFADDVDHVNVYRIKEDDLEADINGDTFSVNNFTFYPISKKSGTEYGSAKDIDGNEYIADDYDSVYDDYSKSSIWIITP